MPALPPVSAADRDHMVGLAEADFRALAGSRLFITGGTGFFGTWLLEALAAANARLGTGITATILSRDPDQFARRSPHLAANPAFLWWRGDVRSFPPPPGNFDHIIHGATAASAALNSQSPREMFDTIVHGTERVLEFALGAGAASHLFLSSGAIYGPQPPNLAAIPEHHPGGPDPGDPRSAYAEGKRAAELLCALTPGLPTKVARCFAFIGPHLPLDAHFAAGNFLRDALAGRDIIILGDGRPLRSYLYAADLVVWLLAILVRGQAGRPYNVGSDQAVSIADLAHLVARQHSQPPPVTILGTPGQGPAERYIPDIARARQELGSELSIDLAAAIARTWRWLNSTPPCTL